MVITAGEEKALESILATNTISAKLCNKHVRLGEVRSEHRILLKTASRSEDEIGIIFFSEVLKFPNRCESTAIPRFLCLRPDRFECVVSKNIPKGYRKLSDIIAEAYGSLQNSEIDPVINQELVESLIYC